MHAGKIAGPEVAAEQVQGRRRSTDSAWVEKTRKAPVKSATRASTVRLTR
jgi:hypothetical protein